MTQAVEKENRSLHIRQFELDGTRSVYCFALVLVVVSQREFYDLLIYDSCDDSDDQIDDA